MKKSRKVQVKHVEMLVNVMVVDIRCIAVEAHLQGKMKIPEFMLNVGQKISFPVEGIRAKCKGVICDVHPDEISMVFPFCEDLDAIASEGSPIPLSFGDIVDLFKKWEPRLKEIHRGAR